MEYDFKRRNRYWAAIILFLCLYPGCGDSGSDGSSSNLLVPGAGGGNNIPGTDPGTGNATVQFGSIRFDGATATAVDSSEMFMSPGTPGVRSTLPTQTRTLPPRRPTCSSQNTTGGGLSNGSGSWVRRSTSPERDRCRPSRQRSRCWIYLRNLFGANKNANNTTSDFSSASSTRPEHRS